MAHTQQPVSPEIARTGALGYLAPNSYYLLLEHKPVCRFQVRLAQAVQPQLLQAALDAVLPRTPYFAQRLLWQNGVPALVPNAAPCLVRSGSRQPAIPEDTGGYLFAVSCEGHTIYLDWYHLIADGVGIFPLLGQLVREYCNLAFGTAFACGPIPSAAPYDPALLREFAPTRLADAPQSGPAQPLASRVQRLRLRVPWQDLLAVATACGAKPMSCMLALFSEAAAPFVQGDTVCYSYTVSSREAMGVPDARYNCVANYRATLPRSSLATLAGALPALDEAVRHNLQPQVMRAYVQSKMGFVYKVNGIRGPLRARQAVFRRALATEGALPDVWLTYLGNVLQPQSSGLAPYVKGFEAWIPPVLGRLFVEAARLDDELVFCIQHRYPAPGLGQAICDTFRREGVRVLACDLLPSAAPPAL